MTALFGNVLIFRLNLIRSIIQALAVTSSEIMVKQIFIWNYYIFVDCCSVEYSRLSSSDPLFSIYNPDNALLIPVLTYNTSGLPVIMAARNCTNELSAGDLGPLSSIEIGQVAIYSIVCLCVVRLQELLHLAKTHKTSYNFKRVAPE